MQTPPESAPSHASPKRKVTANAFGIFVATRRVELGMTQDMLAEKVADVRASIANIERGGRPPYEAEQRLVALAEALQTDAGALIQLAGENRPDYRLEGAGVGVTNLHREVGLLLGQGWGQFAEEALQLALAEVENGETVEPSPDTEASPFGRWLLETRLARDVNQGDFAKLGIARSYISMVETGAKGASWDEQKLKAIAKLLKADLDEMLRLVARSRQYYRVESHVGQPGEVSLLHRQLAHALSSRWLTLSPKTLRRVLEAFSLVASIQANLMDLGRRMRALELERAMAHAGATPAAPPSPRPAATDAPACKATRRPRSSVLKAAAARGGAPSPRLAPVAPAAAAKPRAAAAPPAPTMAAEAEADEKQRILAALEATNWNKVEAGKQLGMPRRTLYRRLREYGIE